MELKTYFALDGNARVIPNVRFYVYLAGTNTLAPYLEDENGVELPNPFSSGTTGKVFFSAPNGDYDIRSVKNGVESVERVQFNDVSDSVDAAADSATAAADSAQDAADDRQVVEQTAQSVEQIAQQVSSDATQASESASDAVAAKEAAEQTLGEFDILIADVERRQFEAATGGACTIERTADGDAAHMFILPKMTWQDLVPSGELGTGVHEAFIEDGVVKSELLIGMYLAASMTGSGTSSTRLTSQPGLAPRRSINWDDSVSAAQAAGFDIMSNWEWTAIAFWCMANGFQPRGNTNEGQSHSHPHERGAKGVDIGSSSSNNTATGSGPNTWRHNNAPNGIADLVGNVWEWQWGSKMVEGRVFLAPDNDKTLPESAWVDTGWDMPTDRVWSSMDNEGASQEVMRALIAPNGVADPDGYLHATFEGERILLRGSTRSNAGLAGLGALNFNDERTNSSRFRGLRFSRLV